MTFHLNESAAAGRAVAWLGPNGLRSARVIRQAYRVRGWAGD